MLTSLLTSWSTSLLTSLTSEQIEGIELVVWTTQNCGLNSMGCVRTVELDSSKLRSLYVSSQLSCGIETSLLVPAEAKASLCSDTNTIRITIIDAACYEASNSAFTLSIQLKTSGEGCTDSSTAVTDLSGHSKLRNELSIGINSSSKAWPEGEVTILSKQTVTGSYSSNTSQTCPSSKVQKPMIRIGID